MIKSKTKGADIMDEMKAISESDNEVVADLRQIVGVFLYIPKMRTVLKAEIDKAIYADFGAGLSFKQIALKYGISEITARDLVQEERKSKKD